MIPVLRFHARRTHKLIELVQPPAKQLQEHSHRGSVSGKPPGILHPVRKAHLLLNDPVHKLQPWERAFGKIFPFMAEDC